jgi:luciferase family oxidoreductase group 1
MDDSSVRFKLSVLDATSIGPHVQGVQAVRWTVEAAKMADNCGFHRFWVVEHHCNPDIGGSSPSLLIAHLTACTRRIRLGSGGVMLPNHAPMRIAEEFLMLEALAEGRIDLGLGRAGGMGPKLDRALRRAPDEFEDLELQIEELQGFLTDTLPLDHPSYGLTISLRVAPPPIFLLGSSPSSAQFAGLKGLSFAFAHHLDPTKTIDSLAQYRKYFAAAQHPDKPYTIVTVAVVCALDAESAEASALAALIPKMRRGFASQHGIPVSDDILSYPEWSDHEVASLRAEIEKGWLFVGTPSQIRLKLSALHDATSCDEMMLTTVEYDGASRIRTLRLIAEEFFSPLP